MDNKILTYLDRGRFEEIVEYIIQDKKLKGREKLILIILFNQADNKLPDIDKLAELSSLSPEEIEVSLNNLIKHNWCRKKILETTSDKTAYYLKSPFQKNKNDSSLYNQPGSKIAQKWSDIFGTRQLTPTNLNKFTSFISDGIEEDVIIEVMKISAENAEGNPVNYALNVLNNYLKRGIETWEEFKNERSEHEKYERQIQKNNRAKEKRKELHDIEQLKKRGWND